MKKENLLTLLIVAALVLGVLVGQFVLFNSSLSADALQSRTEPWQIAGRLVFINPLMMLIIPLVFVSVLVGVTSIGNPQKLGLIGGATLVFYLSTMAIAVVLGLTLSTLIRPGVGISAESIGAGAVGSVDPGGPTSVGSAFVGLFEQMIPSNALKAAIEGNTLAAVTAGILVGLALILGGEKCRPAVRFFEAMFDALIRIVVWVIWLAPLGIFLYVAGRVGEIGLQQLIGPLGKYVLTVILGLLIHGLVTLPLILWLFTRVNPYAFLISIRKVWLTAFSTASSSATLPISIEETQRVGGCSRRASNFVLPLGATINMDGTALYQAVAVVFLFQMHGIDLTLSQLLIVLVTATLAAVGAAGIPSAGLVTMAIVINAVNASLVAVQGEGAHTLPKESIVIILGVDRILDMCRTAVNVWGDCIGARLITRLAPDTEEDREKALA